MSYPGFAQDIPGLLWKNKLNSFEYGQKPTFALEGSNKWNTTTIPKGLLPKWTPKRKPSTIAKGLSEERSASRTKADKKTSERGDPICASTNSSNNNNNNNNSNRRIKDQKNNRRKTRTKRSKRKVIHNHPQTRRKETYNHKQKDIHNHSSSPSVSMNAGKHIFKIWWFWHILTNALRKQITFRKLINTAVPWANTPAACQAMPSVNNWDVVFV